MSKRFNVFPFDKPERPSLRWKLDGYHTDGRRVRRYFETKIQADFECDKLNGETTGTGLKGRLTDAQRIQSELCLAKCAEANRTLEEVVAAGLAHLVRKERSVTVSEAYDHMLADKKGKGYVYLNQLKNMLKIFVAIHGERTLADFTTQELDEFIHDRDAAAKSINNLRGYICTLWNHAVKKGLTQDNPAKNTTFADDDTHDAAILTPASMRAVIQAAKDICPASVAPLVIQAFAGLRTAEVARLDWSEVDLEDGHITVTKGKAKTRSRRTIPIQSNLAELLAPFAKSKGRVTKSCHPLESTLIRAAVVAKGHAWPKNGLRHSFCSYRLTESDNENVTALEAGHSPSMLHRHYKGLASKKAAAEWWAIGLPKV